MKLKIILKLALKHLLTKKLRTFITVGGMAVGVGVIVFLLSFGFGLQHVVTEQLVNLKSINTLTITSQKSKILSLNADNINALKQISHVKEVVGLLSTAGKASYGGSTTDIVVYGTTNRYLQLSDVDPSAGKLFEDSYDANNINAIINTVALDTIGIKNTKDAVGKILEVKIVPNKATSDGSSPSEKSLKVNIVGVTSDTAGSYIYVNKELLESLGFTTYSQVLALTDDRNSIPSVREKIESKGFTTSSPYDTLNQINQVFQVLNLFLAGMGTVGLLIAAGGMFNTLTVSLLERTREIALMKILGARQRDIGKLFLAEAVVMTFIGGCLGVGFAFAVGMVLNIWLGVLATRSGAQAVALFRVPLEFALFIILFSVILGLATAFYPSRRGMKINPLQALKQE